MARTEAVEKALYLRQWGVPFDALAYVFGRDALFGYRAWLTFGRPSLLGTTVKDQAKIPTHRVADEKVTWVAGQEVYVPTTVSAGCFLGVSVVAKADTATLEAGYGEFAREAQALVPDYHLHSVYTDGWKATREAWRCLFPKITRVLCFLHSILKIKDHCTGPLRHQVLERAWQVYQAATQRQFILYLPKALHPCNPGSHNVCGAWANGRRRISVCATATRPPPAHGWRSARWPCNGTFTPMARACDVTRQRGYVLFMT